MVFLRFIPTLIAIVHRFCVYNARYSQQIRANMPPALLPAYDAMRAACDAFMAAVAVIS